MARNFRIFPLVLCLVAVVLGSAPASSLADSTEPVQLRLDAALGPELFVRFRELPLAADAGTGARAADIGGPTLLHLAGLQIPRRSSAVDLLRGWLAALSARDDLWVLRMLEQHALERALANSIDGEPKLLALQHEQARQREARAVSTLAAQLSALQATTDGAGLPRLPFIKPADLLISGTEAQADADAPARAAHSVDTDPLQRIASGMEAVDAARQALLLSQRALRGGGGSPANVAAARAGLAAAWRDLYSVSYEQLLVQAERDAKDAPPGTGWLERWSALFSDVPPSY